jgi:methylglutaconyl-CoA hydratase
MPEEHAEIAVRVDATLGTICINRPQAGNALTLDMAEALVDAVGDLHLERKVRAVVLMGAGEAFCSGRDLHEMHDGHDVLPPGELPRSDDSWGDEANQFREVLVALLEFPKPVIAAINGPVSGFGVALLLASDIVVASPDARLSLPAPRHGLVDGLVAPLLAYRAGASLAARLLLSAEDFAADEMHRLGLYHELLSADLLWARAAEIASQLRFTAHESISLTKRLMLETAGTQLLTDLTSGAVASATARTTPAAHEGVKAFVEGRPPEWS